MPFPQPISRLYLAICYFFRKNGNATQEPEENGVYRSPMQSRTLFAVHSSYRRWYKDRQLLMGVIRFNLTLNPFIRTSGASHNVSKSVSKENLQDVWIDGGLNEGIWCRNGVVTLFLPPKHIYTLFRYDLQN